MTAVQSSGSGISFLLAVAFFFRQWEVSSGSGNYLTDRENALCILFPTGVTTAQTGEELTKKELKQVEAVGI
nr:hypothetical protein [Tanacetum cinerariifolium]